LLGYIIQSKDSYFKFLKVSNQYAHEYAFFKDYETANLALMMYVHKIMCYYEYIEQYSNENPEDFSWFKEYYQENLYVIDENPEYFL